MLVNNSLTRVIEPLILPQDKNIKWYSCGPTVYDHSHIGHARNYVSFDIIRRILEDYLGYRVTYVMNITDIDDKIIDRANQEKIKFSDWALKWEIEFFQDMDRLNVKPPTVIARVSEYIPEIINYISRLMEKDMAYCSNGSVYFNLTNFHRQFKYGKLSKPGEPGFPPQGETLGKLAVQDFAVWKANKPGEPFWESPWGQGRPGWHIECSVMAGAILGDHIHIHSGGEDLKFPHHDNELAQSDAYYGKEGWVDYFLHSGHLRIKGEKMAKSRKNYITIQEVLQEYTARQIRILFLLHNYDTLIE